MAKNLFYIFPDQDSASIILQQVNEIMGFKEGLPTARWCDLEIHPTTNECLIYYNEQIELCSHLFDSMEPITKVEAVKKGWYFGFHKGRYSKLIAKLEEAELLYQSIVENYGKSSFPVQKALLLSFAYACYSMKETLQYLSRYKDKGGNIYNKNSNQHQQNWWNEKWQKEISAEGSLLKYFNQLHNCDKHSTSLFLIPKAKYFNTIEGGGCYTCVGSQFMTTADGKFYLGSEGYFDIDLSGLFPIRKVVIDPSILLTRYGIYEIEIEYELLGVPNIHLGREIKHDSTLDTITAIRDYWVEIINEAISKYP